jgi:hypothetical protein
MGVTPGSVHEKTSLVLSDGLGESLWALLNNDVSPALLARFSGVNLLSSVVEELWHDDFALEFRLADLALDTGTIDSNICQVGKQLLGTILAANEIEKLGGIIDEGSPACAFDKSGVSE